MLRQSGAFARARGVTDRVHGLDGPGARARDHDPRQERGDPLRRGVKLNIVDTPGPRRLRRRGRARPDDGRRRAAPRRRLRGAAAADALRASQGARARLPVILVVNKVDRPDARIARSWTRSTSCSSTSTPTSRRSTSRSSTRTRRRAGRRSRGRRGVRPEAAPGPPASSTCRPEYDEGHGLQALVTNLDASPYVGRLALCRIHNGVHAARASRWRWCRRDGTIERVGVAELYVAEGLGRTDAAEAGPGEIVAVAGHPRDHDRRDDRRPGRPAAAAADQRRRARARHDDRHQHLAARRAGRARKLTARQVSEPARGRARRQRVDPGARDRAARHVGGAGPRRAAARRAGRDDAARGVRADRREAPGGHARDRRRRCTSRSSAWPSTCLRTSSA